MDDSRGRGRGRGERGQRGRGVSPGQRGGSPMYRGGRGDSPSGSSGRGSPAGFRGGGGGGGGRGRGGPVQIFSPNAPAQPDARLSDKEQNALIASFKSLSTSVPDRVVRPGFGKRGAAITLRANFFALKYPKNVVLYDYAIEIKPAVKTEEKPVGVHGGGSAISS
ncbi:hypothetical protein DFH11DRAFT_1548366 [Phellopilus nigrolimitatus]|nr:hypothetical protein DFH11DRAFT_1548366 [Phellopilus nigrolimitatus]